MSEPAPKLSDGVPALALSSGRHGLAGERVLDIQRARMLAAAVQVVSDVGARSLTASNVVARAGVSRSAFYAAFDDTEDCFQAAFEQAVERAARTVVAAYESKRAWSERVRAGLVALLEFLDFEPALARLCVVEVLAAGPGALQSRASVLDALVDAVDRGREQPEVDGALTPLHAEGVVGAVFAIIYTRLLTHDPNPLIELTSPLMNLIVLPYLGPDAARRELDRPIPKPCAKAFSSRPGPFRGSAKRITYRTARVLGAIAQQPGASNRQLAQAADISDSGQMSRLLGRLARKGLIYNIGPGRSKGTPNAWALTPNGTELLCLLRAGR